MGSLLCRLHKRILIAIPALISVLGIAPALFFALPDSFHDAGGAGIVRQQRAPDGGTICVSVAACHSFHE